MKAAAGGRLSALALIAIWLSACATLRVGSDFDRTASFSGYHAFAFLPQQRHNSRNPLVTQRVRDAIEAVLTGRGFTFVSNMADADFVVDFTIGSRERTDVESYPAPYTGWYGGYGGWWGYSYWGAGVDVRTYREGTLAIDIFDAHTYRPVWHGWAKKELTDDDLEHSEGPIRTAVGTVLSRFPPE
jgi:hypothetical protein